MPCSSEAVGLPSYKFMGLARLAGWLGGLQMCSNSLCIQCIYYRHLWLNLLDRLIQNLLLNAKLRFANSSDSAGVELYDTYLSRVELLHLLVTSQCSKIPSLQELTNPDLARRVRDRLIQDDRFLLAMEVSTKCQLDASAVWSAWGMMALKSGDFQTAREKFIRCSL